jgi:malate dehydrogenase
MGVSHLDIIRASTFVATVAGHPADALKYTIPVVGGHSGATILPLLSQSKPAIVCSLSIYLHITSSV